METNKSEYQKASKKDKEILAKIQSSGKEARRSGLKSNVPEQGVDTGYLIFLKYTPEDSLPIANFSLEIKNSLDGKSIVYSAENIHQTIADYCLEHHEKDDFKPEKKILSKLETSVSDAMDNLLRKDIQDVWNSFGKYINNNNSVILRPLRGVNSGTYHLITLVKEKTDENGLDVRSAWGTHITTSRFTEEILPEEIGEFNKLMEHASYPNASNDGDLIWPDSLNLGFYRLNKKGFNLETVKEFSLK